MTTILVTGAAGFIGFHVSQRLLKRGDRVIGIDNLNPYYDVSLKQARLERLQSDPAFTFYHLSLEDGSAMEELFVQYSPTKVVNLAAQPGVRYSLQNPQAYISSNLVGFTNILEQCRHRHIEHLVYASSSSVYGKNIKVPFSEHDPVNHPISLYAATKKANELLAHTYSHLFALPTTGLRFFTVYGPWGRPDMAAFLFTRAILEGRPIEIFNEGRMQRDFTYVDDIAEGVVRTLDRPPKPDPGWNAETPDPATSDAPYRIYNIGNHQPAPLGYFIETLEKLLGKEAIKNYMPMQPGDVVSTYAEVSDLMRDTGFSPHTPLEEGLKHFVEWYREYYDV